MVQLHSFHFSMPQNSIQTAIIGEKTRVPELSKYKVWLFPKSFLKTCFLLNENIFINIINVFSFIKLDSSTCFDFFMDTVRILENFAVNDRKYVFHFRPKPKPKPEKHQALGRIPKPKVQIYVKIGGILLKFNVSNDFK